MIDASVAGVRGATVTVRGGAHVAAAGIGSGDDCRLFGLYAFDGQFAVDASWVDATSAIADAACVIDASGAVAQHVVIEPTGARPLAGKTQPGTDESTGGNPAGVTKPGSEEELSDETKPSEDPALTPNPSHEHDVKPAPASAKTPATKTAKKTRPASTPAAASS